MGFLSLQTKPQREFLCINCIDTYMYKEIFQVDIVSFTNTFSEIACRWRQFVALSPRNVSYACHWVHFRSLF